METMVLTEIVSLDATCVLTPHALEIGRTNGTISGEHAVELLIIVHYSHDESEVKVMAEVVDEVSDLPMIAAVSELQHKGWVRS